MRDYRSYENRRRAAGRRRDSGGPRALLIGFGVFAFAAVVVGAVLAFGGDDDEPPENAALVIQPATPTAATFDFAPSPTTQVQPPGVTVPGATSTIVIQAAGTPEPAVSTETPEAAPEELAETPVVEEPEPTEEPTTAVDEPAVEPATGDFGVLPAADIPSGGLGRDIVLDYDVAIGAADLPAEATVYHMLWAGHSAESAAALAATLGVSGDVSGSDGNFHVEGADGSLTISGASVQYQYGGKVPPDALADDATILASAADWLLTNGLVLNDLGPGSVIGRDELGARVSAVFYSTDPETLLSVYPSARLTLGPGPTVLEAYVIWPSGYESSVYGLRTLDDLLGDLYDGRGFIEADLSAVPGEGQVLGTLTITSASLAYSTAGSSDSGQFLTPVMVFSGEATLTDSD